MAKVFKDELVGWGAFWLSLFIIVGVLVTIFWVIPVGIQMLVFGEWWWPDVLLADLIGIVGFSLYKWARRF